MIGDEDISIYIWDGPFNLVEVRWKNVFFLANLRQMFSLSIPTHSLYCFYNLSACKLFFALFDCTNIFLTISSIPVREIERSATIGTRGCAGID